MFNPKRIIYTLKLKCLPCFTVLPTAHGFIIISPFIVFLQDGNHGDPVLGPHLPPFLSGPCYDGRRLQVSASGAAQSLLLDQRDVRGAKRHRLRLNPHQLPGSHDKYSEFSFHLQIVV